MIMALFDKLQRSFRKTSIHQDTTLPAVPFSVIRDHYIVRADVDTEITSYAIVAINCHTLIRRRRVRHHIHSFFHFGLTPF